MTVGAFAPRPRSETEHFRARQPAPRGPQRGQSLVLGSLLLMLVTVVLLAMFNSAQFTSTRMELQNTADATAYSVGTVAARDYNFSAYMNRAMVANQVAAAQVVGLASWSRFVGRTLKNIETLCAPIPGADAVCAAVAETYSVYAKAFETTVLPPLMKIIGGWLTALSGLQMAFHVGSGEAIAQNLVALGDIGLDAGVLKRNDPDASVLSWPDSHGDLPGELYRLAIVMKDAVQWWNYTKRYSEGDELQRFAGVIGNSLDDFSRQRKWNEHSITVKDGAWIIKHFLKFISVPDWVMEAIKTVLPVSASMTMKIVRRGGTELKAVEKKFSWSGADTLITKIKVHITAHFPYPSVCCGKWVCWPCTKYLKKTFDSPEVPIPVGWGAAYSTALDDGTSGEKIFNAHPNGKDYGGAADGWQQQVAFQLAVAEFGKTPMAGRIPGVKPYYDIADTAAKSREGPQFTFVVSKATDKVRTAARAGFGLPGQDGPGGLPAVGLADPAHPKNFYAIAKGRLRFARDDRYSSLFGPYWEAGLADTGTQERVLAYEALSGDWAHPKEWIDLLPDVLGSSGSAELSPYEP